MALIHLTIAIVFVMAGNHAVHTPADSTIISGLQFGSVSTYWNTTSQIYHMEVDLYVPGNLLYSEGTSLSSTDGNNTFIVVGHPKTAGYLEGSAVSAHFSAITGFFQIENNLILVVDQGNHCLRLVPRFESKTSQYTGICKSPGYRDGQGDDVMFNLPYSVVGDPSFRDRVFITDSGNTALRLLHLLTRTVETIVKTGSDGPYHASVDNILSTVYLSYGAYFGKVDLNTKVYTNITCKTDIGSFDGKFDRTSFAGARELLKVNNEVVLIADRKSNLVRVVDLKESWVRSICTRGLSLASPIDGPVTNCSFNSPTSLLLDGNSLYIGEFQAIRRVTVQSYEPKCVSRTWNVILNPYEKTAPVEVTPGVIIYYPIGNYIYEIPGRNCKVNVIVIPDKCPDPVYLVADSATGVGAFSFEGADNVNKIQLPVGTYEVLSRTESSDCLLNVTVMSPTLKRRMDFKAIYSLPCDATATDVAKKDLKEVARFKYYQIERFCDGGCARPPGDGILISCENDMTTVTWTTERLYEANVFSVPRSFRNWVKEKMGMDQGNNLQLSVNTRIPPVINPNKNKDGMVASLVLTPVCVIGTSDMVLDSCKDRETSWCCKTLEYWKSLATLNENSSITQGIRKSIIRFYEDGSISPNPSAVRESLVTEYTTTSTTTTTTTTTTTVS